MITISTPFAHLWAARTYIALRSLTRKAAKARLIPPFAHSSETGGETRLVSRARLSLPVDFLQTRARPSPALAEACRCRRASRDPRARAPLTANWTLRSPVVISKQFLRARAEGSRCVMRTASVLALRAGPVPPCLCLSAARHATRQAPTRRVTEVVKSGEDLLRS